MGLRRVFILRGEGIECERESFRFFQSNDLYCEPQYLFVQDLLKDPNAVLRTSRPGDIVFFPGGFSFADHFGSGKLLSYKLSEKGLFKNFLTHELHLVGGCNGFQVLAEAGLFGKSVELKHNSKEGQGFGFTNRWISTTGLGPIEGKTFSLPVRHGEGRLSRETSSWEAHVRPILRYDDPAFDNGSIDQVAGLWAKHGKSQVVGMMPHPEIALRPLDGPDNIGPETAALLTRNVSTHTGDGLRLMRDLFKEILKEG